MPWLIRIGCILLLVVAGIVLVHKTNVLRAGWKKALYLLGALLLSAALVLFPLEYFFYGFPTIETALRFSSPGMSLDSMRVVEGERSALVMSPNEETVGIYLAILVKTDSGWEGMNMRDSMPRARGYNEVAVVELYECQQAGECYVLVMPLRNAQISVKDTKGTDFEEIQGVYAAYLGELDEGYQLFVNGEEIPISGLSP